jgi:hypothetical protein
MDVVITYVNWNDPVWQREYARCAVEPMLKKRFRDWGTLKYLLRGIEKFMPFVGKVFLVVSGPTQIPPWASSELRPVFHEDILPKKLVPTFNSCTIEMGIHRIEGLNERFLYFNDDMFPMAPCREEDFFSDGKVAIRFEPGLFGCGIYKRNCLNSDRLARKCLGMPPSLFFMRPQHICSPMLRSVCEEAYSKAEEEILRVSTRLREAENVNQYFFLDYMYYSGRAVSRAISKKHFSLALSSPDKILDFIYSSTARFACINDVSMSERKFIHSRELLLNAFERKFPDKSRFEE